MRSVLSSASLASVLQAASFTHDLAQSCSVQPTENEIARVAQASSCLHPPAPLAAAAALAVQFAPRLRSDKTAKMSQPEPLLKPNPSALALDIDGTITTASPAVVHELVRAARVLGSKVAVNTARPASYCRDPYLTKFLNIPLEDHYCYDGNVPWTFRNLIGGGVPAAKVRALESIRENAGVVDKRCVILVDDRGENIAAAHRAGFGVLQVSDERGVSMADAKSLVVRLQECRRAFAGLEKAERKLTRRK